MTKKQKNCINDLLKRKKAFARFVQLFLKEAEARGITPLVIVSHNGEFEWWNKENEAD